jgi:alkylhydroperoxidase family enzyme
LEPLPPGEWPEGMKAALGALRPAPDDQRHPFPPRDPSRPKGLNILGLLAHHPTLTTAYHTLVGHLLYGTTLTERQRELLILRVAHLRDAEYEWAQHAVLAGDVGIVAADVRSLDGWSGLDAALLTAADELVADARISDATWATLASDLDEQQLLDVIFTVGAYDLLAMAMRSCDLELDDDLRRSP